MKAVELLKQGIIWSDPWLPRGTKRRVSSHQGAVLLNRVCEPINPQSGQWDTDLVRGIFNENDVPVILFIPVRGNREDFIARHFDQKGIFSVKSAYKVCVDTASEQHGPSNGSTVQCPTLGTTFAWKKIWLLSCPNKVKHFIWRLAHNRLPMKRMIKHRGMQIDTRCPICFRMEGTCFSNVNTLELYGETSSSKNTELLYLARCRQGRYWNRFGNGKKKSNLNASQLCGFCGQRAMILM
jgi:hypothetical protein